MEDEYLTVDELAALIKCSKLTLYGMVARKKIPFKKPSRRLLRFKKTEIKDWIDGKYLRNEVGPTASGKKTPKRKLSYATNIKGIVDLARKEVLGA